MRDEFISNLKDQLKAGQIDRRQFMRGAVAAGVAVTAATSFADSVEAASPKKGGTVRVGKGHGQTTDTLDPGLWENGFTIGMGFGYQGYLTEVDSDGSLVPSIAESWEGSADASTWTFKIRDAEFHNGKSVTAQDVIASLNHHRGESTTSAAAPLVSPVTNLTADGDKTVVVELEAGNADFPFIVSDYHMPIQPANADGSQNWQDGVGCGAYKLDHFDAGVSAELSRHANHWTDDRGHFDGVQLLSLVDPNARTAALVSGDVHVIDKVDLKTAGLLGRKPGVNIHQVSGTQHYSFPMLSDRAPFDNVNVRRALKHSINRQELVDKILFGYGEVGNDVPIGKGQRFYNHDMPQTPYDPDKAKFFLKEAGMSSLQVNLSAADAAFPGAVDAAVLMQASGKAAGVEINVVREPNDGYWSDVWQNKDWCACYWSGRPVEDMMFSTAYECGVAWNDMAWCHDRFNTLLKAARAELDDDKRREMYYEMQVIVNDEGSVAIPMFASYVFATGDAVGLPGSFGSNWDMDGERWMERWWLA